MRIMLVTDQYPPMVGGVPTVTHGLALDFAQRGHQVWVVAPNYNSHDERRLEQEVRVYRFSSFEWPTYEGLRIPFLPFMPVRNLIRKSDPDIIHIHSPVVLGNIAQMLAGGLRKPVIATNHYLPINISPYLTSDPFIGKSFNRMTYSYIVNFLNRCEYVTAPTYTALNLLYENGLRAPARVLSNGIDLAKFTPGPRDPAILQHFKLPTDRPLILHVNRLSEEKRVNVLLDAMAQIKSNAHLALVSTGPAEAELRAQTERLHLYDRVSFLGYVRDQELLQLRHSADIFVIPSEADLQSLATMEAMACALPVIAANSYALPELVHHQENGLLFPPGDSTALAAALDQLLENTPLRLQMGQESLRIVSKHDRITVLNEWEALYNRLSVEFREAKQRKQHQRTLSKYSDRLSPDLPKISQPRIRLSKDPDFQRTKKTSSRTRRDGMVR
jgi:phosphatidylinositol alpha 1,6-mannosyltransferase